MKKFICLILALTMALLVFSSCKKEDEESTRVAPSAADIDMSEISSLDGITEAEEITDYVLISVENYGDILVRLYPDVAPQTVANFQKLVSEHFYDGLIFHRVIKNFVIQGGDPKGNGTGGSSETIYGEFSQNGFENNLAHKRGVLAMARSNDKNSASSQFYICHKDSGVTQLDGSYATFGYVVYGMDTVDKIAKVSVDDNDKPLKSVVITSIKFVNV